MECFSKRAEPRRSAHNGDGTSSRINANRSNPGVGQVLTLPELIIIQGSDYKEPREARGDDVL